MFMILGLIVALPSLIIFFIPYQLTKVIFRNKVKSTMVEDDKGENFDYAFMGTLIFAVGILLFGLWTPIIGAIVYFSTSIWWLGVLSMLVLYPMFQFSMLYGKVGLRMLNYYRGKRIRKQNKERVEFYTQERKAIIEKLKDYQISYVTSGTSMDAN